MSSLLRDIERVQPAEAPKDEPEGAEIIGAFQEALNKLSEKVDSLTSQLSELTKETEKPKDPDDKDLDDKDPGDKDPEEEE